MKTCMCGLAGMVIGLLLGGAACAEVRTTEMEREASPVEVPAKKPGLKLGSVSRFGLEQTSIQFHFRIEPSLAQWSRFSEYPSFHQLTSAGGKSLLEPAGRELRERKLGRIGSPWRKPGSGDHASLSSPTGKEFEKFGVVEVGAECEVPTGIEYIDLGVITDKTRVVEISATEKVRISFQPNPRRYACHVSVPDSNSPSGTRFFVGVETFDASGRPSGAWELNDNNYRFPAGDKVPARARIVVGTGIEHIRLDMHQEDVLLDELQVKRWMNMSVSSLRNDLQETKYEEDLLREGLYEAIRKDEERIAEVFIDAGVRAPVGGDEDPDSAVTKRCLRLFRRSLEIAKKASKQAAIDEAYADSLFYKHDQFGKAALAAGANVFHITHYGDTLLMSLWITHPLPSEVGDAYAKEVIEHGANFEIASRDGFGEVLAAAYAGENDRLRRLLGDGKGAPARDVHDRNALGWACMSPHATTETLSILLEAGVSWGDGSDEDPSALEEALRNERIDLAIELARLGAAKGLKREIREKVSRLAALSKSEELIRAIAAAAPRMDHEEAVGLMIRSSGQNADAETLGKAIETVRSSQMENDEIRDSLSSGLTVAAHDGVIAHVRALIEAGARPLVQKGDTAMHWAAGGEDEELFDLIFNAAVKEKCLAKGRVYGVGAKVGEDGLAMACAAKKEKRVERLLGAGVTLSEEETWDDGPLAAAARSGSTKIVKMLLDHGANVNIVNRGGETPLLCAINPNWSPELLKLLVEKGARMDVCTRLDKRQTIVIAAARIGDADLLNEVLKLGAPTSAAPIGNVGESIKIYDALATCMEVGDVKAVRMLLEAGVKPGKFKLWVREPELTHLEFAKRLESFKHSEPAKEILKMIEAVCK